MRYVYNRIITGEEKEFEYQGDIYYQSGKNHMGAIDYFTYTRQGQEPVLVVPSFACQFKEVVEMYDKIKNVHTDKAVRIRLKAMFGRNPSVECFNAGTERRYAYQVKHKEIEVYMSLENGVFKLSSFFKITSKRILDNTHDINAGISPDFEEYFDALDAWAKASLKEMRETAQETAQETEQ